MQTILEGSLEKEKETWGSPFPGNPEFGDFWGGPGFFWRSGFSFGGTRCKPHCKRHLKGLVESLPRGPQAWILFWGSRSFKGTRCNPLRKTLEKEAWGAPYPGNPELGDSLGVRASFGDKMQTLLEGTLEKERLAWRLFVTVGIASPSFPRAQVPSAATTCASRPGCDTELNPDPQVSRV